MVIVKEVTNDNAENEIRELEEMLSNLNPLAREFVPPSRTRFTTVQHPFYHHSNHQQQHYPHQQHHHQQHYQQQQQQPQPASPFSPQSSRRNTGAPRRRSTRRTGLAQRDEVIRRTVFVSDIDHLVTEEELASLFLRCGQIVDCRICGDPKNLLRIAFIEFSHHYGADAALSLAGTVLGYSPLKVRPSKTAIAPVNPSLLPQSEFEREMCARTIYCTNIDKKVTEPDLILFFESVCGQIFRSRMLGDQRHPTRIAFIEFMRAESATAALNCSGVVLGSFAIRVSPSKTPVRPSHQTPARPSHQTPARKSKVSARSRAQKQPRR